MRVRAAEKRDIPRLVSIWKDSASSALGSALPTPNDMEPAEYLSRQMSTATHPFGFWVAEDETQLVVGWQWLMPFHNNPVMRFVTAESSTYVAREAFGRRVGELLLRHAMSAAQASRLKFVIGFVVHESAERLVRRCGWHLVGAFPPLPRHESPDPIKCYVFAPG